MAPTVPANFHEIFGNKKLLPLREADFAKPVDPEFLMFLETTAKALGREPGSVRVFDFGAGRGDMTGCLRQAGWEAYGADIATKYLKAGEILNQKWPSAPATLSLIGHDGRTVYDDGFFDVVISDQVVEHVEDIDEFASEIRRILKPGGYAYLRFPGSHVFFEPHYFLPFAHWFPSGSAGRSAAIRLFTTIGLGLTTNSPVPASVRAAAIEKYANTETFYRSRKALTAAFVRNGLALDWETLVRRWIVWKARIGGRGDSRSAKAIWPSFALHLIGDCYHWRVLATRLD